MPESIPQIEGRFVIGVGPTPAHVMCLGRNPGLQESRDGRPFIGPAGQELSMYALHAGLNRRQWWITNAYKFFTLDDEPPVDSQFDEHWPIFEKELLLGQPDVLMTFGADCTAYVMQRLALSFRTMDSHYAIPLLAHIDVPPREMPWIEGDPNAMPWLQNLWSAAPDEGSHDFILFPSLHPAAGIHKPTDMCKIDLCFKELRRLLDGEIEPRDPHAPQHHMKRKLVESMEELEAAFAKAGAFIGLDTEGLPDYPWGLTFSAEPWVGYCILVTQPEILQRFITLLADFLKRGNGGEGGKLIIHNSLHDLAVLEAMGIYLPDDSFVDSMVVCFLLGNEPQGLKPQSYRLFDIKMQDYDDVIAPYELRNMQDYFIAAGEIDWDACPKCGAYRGKGTFHPKGGYENIDPDLKRKDGKLRAAVEYEILWCEEEPSDSRAHTISRRLDRLGKDFLGLPALPEPAPDSEKALATEALSA